MHRAEERALRAFSNRHRQDTVHAESAGRLPHCGSHRQRLGGRARAVGVAASHLKVHLGSGAGVYLSLPLHAQSHELLLHIMSPGQLKLSTNVLHSWP